MKNAIREKISEKQETKKKRQFKISPQLKKAYSGIVKRAERIFEKSSDMLTEELERETVSIKERAKILLISLGLSLIGVFISCCAMGESCYPIAVALLCALGTRAQQEGFVPRFYIALSLGAVSASTLFMGSAGVLYFSVLVSVFIIRGVLTSFSFNESSTTRVITAFFTGLIIGTMNLLICDFSLMSSVSFASILILAPIFTYLFIPLFDRIGKKNPDSRFLQHFTVGSLAVVFITVLSLGEIKIFGLSLSFILSFSLTLGMSKRFGSMTAGAVGAVLGIACNSPVAVGVLGGVGVVSALLFPHDLYALLASLPVSVVISIFLGGTKGFLACTPEIMASFLIMWPVLLKIPMNSPKISEQRLRPRLGGVNFGERLERMSGAFSSLSEVFFAVCETAAEPDAEKIRGVVENACNGICATCSASGMCWGKRWRDTNGIIDGVSEQMIKNGCVTLEDFPEYFRQRCVKAEILCDAVNKSCNLYGKEKGSLERANLIAGEYRTVSKLLKSAADIFSKYPERHEEMSKRVSCVLDKLGIEYDFVEVWGGRSTVIDVIGASCEKIPLSTLELIGIFENVCDLKLEEPEFIVSEETPVMRLKRRRAIHLECSKKSCSKKGESTSGDTVTFFENDNGNFYSLVCDGMGSGREAAITSRLASVFLEKLLRCTDDRGVTLEMVNRMLINREGECFTTLDLLEIDLYDKKAAFIKAGAAPSYILREGKYYKVNSQTPPAGIIDDLRAEETSVQLRDGDVLILVSDGILDSFDALPVEVDASQSSSEISHTILSQALSRFSARDDMSVAVIRVFDD